MEANVEAEFFVVNLFKGWLSEALLKCTGSKFYYAVVCLHFKFRRFFGQAKIRQW